MKLVADGPQLLEVNGRMTSTIHDACVRLYGSNLVRSRFDTVLGVRPEVVEFDYESKIACQNTPPAPAVLVSVDDVEAVLHDLETLPCVFDTRLCNRAISAAKPKSP